MFQQILVFALFSLATCQFPFVNPITAPILPGPRPVYVRKFSRLPSWNGKPPKIVGLVQFLNHLYVTTSTSGGLIYKIDREGKARRWFDVSSAMKVARNRVMDVSSPGHGGVRGIAFHPDFRKNRLFYVSVMERRKFPLSQYRYLSPPPAKPSPVDSVLLEFQINKRTGRPIAKSYRDVLRIAMPELDHPIKQIAFRGRLLYITHGDGSVQSAVGGGGMKNDGLGKVLRINPLQKGDAPYSIPSTNPFAKGGRYRPEIYAVGFRNPHNLCFAKNGDLFVVDVGRDNIEEINRVEAGGNYGWPKREGPFVHLERGGLLTGVRKLPADDARFGYTYPVVSAGHKQREGSVFVGLAMAGSCPIENGSPLNGLMLYANFPNTGDLFYSFLRDMRAARTKGRPDRLTSAQIYRPKIFYDHDSNRRTPAREVLNLRAIVRMESPYETVDRVDLRFGQGKFGEIYFSSKTNGRIYVFTSSLPNSNM